LAGLSPDLLPRAVMTPDHDRWAEFCARLDEALQSSPAGCNGCGHPAGHEGARAILATMDDVDVTTSLAYFNERGGHCDCEILLNIAAVADES
jgi:hypothetical protein